MQGCWVPKILRVIKYETSICYLSGLLSVVHVSAGSIKLERDENWQPLTNFASWLNRMCLKCSHRKKFQKTINGKGDGKL